MALKKQAVVVLAAITLTTLLSCGDGAATPVEVETPRVSNPDTFVSAGVGEIASVDPAYAYDGSSALQLANIYETLVTYDDIHPGEFEPLLATEWTVSEDGRTYRFKIRNGVRFHDGNRLTPEDVEYSFERGMVQDYGPGPQWMIFEALFGIDIHSSRGDDGLMPLSLITQKVEVDGDWGQFNLAEPFGPFLQILSGPWGSIVDQEWAIEQGDWDGSEASYRALNDPPPEGSPLQLITNGTGPYRLERWEPWVEVVLVRNDDYWREPARIERVVTKVVENWSTRKLMLLSGDADSVYVPDAEAGDLVGADGIRAYEPMPSTQVYAFFFQFVISSDSVFVGSGQLDGQGIPLDFFADLHVRQGMVHAFDWDTFIEEAIDGRGQRAATPIVEGLPNHNPDWPLPEHDFATAEEHFRAAWDGQAWENGFQFTIVYPVGSVEAKVAAEILRVNLLVINPEFKINLQPKAWPAMLREMVGGMLPMFFIDWIADYPDPHNFVFPFMHSDGVFAGWQRYGNPEIDALIKRGVSATDTAERQSVYDQLAEHYLSDAPSFIVHQSQTTVFLRDWVQGYTYNPARPGYMLRYYELSKAP